MARGRAQGNRESRQQANPPQLKFLIESTCTDYLIVIRIDYGFPKKMWCNARS